MFIAPFILVAFIFIISMDVAYAFPVIQSSIRITTKTKSIVTYHSNILPIYLSENNKESSSLSSDVIIGNNLAVSEISDVTDNPSADDDVDKKGN